MDILEIGRRGGKFVRNLASDLIDVESQSKCERPRCAGMEPVLADTISDEEGAAIMKASATDWL